MRARRTHAPPSAYLFVDDAKRHGEPENYFLLWEESSNRNRCKLGHKPHKQVSVTRRARVALEWEALGHGLRVAPHYTPDWAFGLCGHRQIGARRPAGHDAVIGCGFAATAGAEHNERGAEDGQDAAECFCVDAGGNGLNIDEVGQS